MQRYAKLTEDSKGHSSLTRQDLNQKSYMEDAFGLIPKGSIENASITQRQQTELIRGVPKFVQSSKGLRYATQAEAEAIELQQQLQDNSYLEF